MKETFQHRITNSMLLWFDNYLLATGEAYSNKTGSLTYYDDDRLTSSLNAFGSPYKQWVTDSSIVGANVPSGLFIDGVFSSDEIIDYENGRLLVNSGLATTSAITGAFAVKDFNIYYTNSDEDDLIIEQRYVENPRFPMGVEEPIAPYDAAVPAVFIANKGMRNEGFAFGGLEETTVLFTAVVFADDPFQLDGILSIFADAKNETITAIPMSGHPSTEWGDVKGGSYSYQELKAAYASSGYYYIESVVTSKLTDRHRESVSNDLYIGFIDFEVQQHRNRHQ